RSHDAAHRVLAHADIDHVWIALSHRDGTDGTGLEKAIRNVAPGDAHVIRFPKPATRRAHVIRFRIANDSRGAIRTPASKRPNRSPLEGFEDGVVIICGRWFCLRINYWCGLVVQEEAKKKKCDKLQPITNGD